MYQALFWEFYLCDLFNPQWPYAVDILLSFHKEEPCTADLVKWQEPRFKPMEFVSGTLS